MARTLLYRRLRQWLNTSLCPDSAEGEARLRAAEFSRRALLARGSQLLAWSALPACVTSRKAVPMPAPPEEAVRELVIVGGGLAGLTVAYELAKKGLPVRIYEGSDRIGGRVFTSPFAKEGLFCERGAEFVDSGHRDLMELTAELGLPLQRLDDGRQKLQKEIYFFEGRLRSEQEIVRAFKPLAKRLKQDAGDLEVNGAFQMPTYRSARAPVRALDHLSLEAYLHACRGEVDAWVLNLVRIAYVGEYGLEAGEQSALNLLLLISADTAAGLSLFGESDEAFRIQGGSQRLSEALLQRLGQMGVQILRQHECIAIKARAQGFRLAFQVSDRKLDVNCAELVLALPLPILRQIDGLSELDLSPRKKRFIAAFGFGTNSKLMLGFKERYWEQGHPGFPPHSGSVYTDEGSQAFWASSRQQAGRTGILTNFLGGEAGFAPAPGHLTQALRDLERAMPGISALHDGQKILQHWSSIRWARGSYSCPRPGQYTELVGAGGESEVSDTLHFAGEHCSIDSAGYMNGAIGSGRELAASLLKRGRSRASAQDARRIYL